MIRTVMISLGVLAAIGAGVAWLLVSSFPDASNTGYRVTMRPTTALSHRACQAEVRRLRMVVEATACSTGTDRPWFEITITNVHDKNGYPVCTATAYNKAGQALFDWGIPISVVDPFPAGPPLIPGTPLHLVWRFGNRTGDGSYIKHAAWKPTTITHYKATCHGRPSSEVPI
jgi:hypothetical protein